MTLQLTSIELTNFGSFRDHELFPIPKQPGLYHVQGVNQVEPRLTGNGTGKSTIWKGLFWNLFEHTPDGLKAGDVCNWEVSKGARVTLNLAEEGDDDLLWMVTREWKPNRWTLRAEAARITDEETVDLAKGFPNWLKDQLPESPDLFLNCILLAQENPTFLDLKPEAQTTLFGEVLNLDHWLALSQKASAKAAEQDRTNRGLESTVSRLEGIVERKQDFSKQIDEWEAEQQRRLDRAKQQFTEMLDEQERIQIKKADVGSAEEYEALRKMGKRIEVVEKDEREGQRVVSELMAEASFLKRRAAGMLELIDAPEGSCPTCGAPADPKHLADEADHLSTQAKNLLRESEAATVHLDRIRANKQKLIDEYEADKRRLDDLGAARRERERRLTELDRQLDHLEDDYERLRTEPNPWKKAQKEASERARIDQEALLTARKGLDRGYELYALYAYWIKGFKELRLFHIAQALHELEIEVNNSLIELGLVGWEIEFEVDRESKKGTIQRGFNVRVRSPHTERPVPWKAWSGGEKQRLRIAASMGMANLIRARRAPTLALEVWDEPTKGMSPQGVNDLMAALAARARFEQRVIIVVDHTAPEFGDFAGRAMVTKTPEGSRIEVDW